MIATSSAPSTLMPPKQQKLKHVSAYVEDDLKEKLEEWANDEARSVSSLIVLILRKAVADRDEQKK